MKIYRKLFSEKKEEKKENLDNKGITTGSVMAGLGATSYGLARAVEKIGPSYTTRKGIVKVNPLGAKGIKHLKVAGAVLVPVGVGIAATSAGHKYYKKKKGNDNKA